MAHKPKTRAGRFLGAALVEGPAEAVWELRDELDRQAVEEPLQPVKHRA
jgi:hypothetical protein